MTISNDSIKSIAKEIYKSNYIKIIVVTAVFLSVSFICSNISGILSFSTGEYFSLAIYALLSVFVLLPLFVGICRFFWRLSCGVADNPITIFYYFSCKKLYCKVFVLIFSLGIRAIINYFVFSIPAFVLKIISGTWLYSLIKTPIPIWTVNLSGIIGWLSAIAVVATIISMLKFYLAPMLFVADENIDVAEALHLSRVVTKRTMLDFVFLGLSFFGWSLLSVFVVPLIFTLPYITISYLVHCSYSVSAFNEEVTKINHDDIPTYIAGV